MLKCIWTFDRRLLALGAMSAQDEQAAKMVYYRGWIIGADENYNLMYFDPAERVNVISNKELKPMTEQPTGTPAPENEMDPNNPNQGPADPGNGQDAAPPAETPPEPEPEQKPDQEPAEKPDTGSGQT